MPIIQGPLFSLSASGTIHDTLTYQKKRNRNTARAKPTPTGITTPPQANARAVLRWINELWKIAPPLYRNSWNTVAGRANATGYNLSISENMEKLNPVADLTPLLGASALGQGPQTILSSFSRLAFFVRIGGTQPTVPIGWTFVQRIAMVMHNLDPRTDLPTDVAIGVSPLLGGLIVILIDDVTPPLVATMWVQWLNERGQTVYSPPANGTLPAI